MLKAKNMPIVKRTIKRDLRPARAALGSTGEVNEAAQDMQSTLGAAANAVNRSPTNVAIYESDASAISAANAAMAGVVARVPVLSYRESELRFNNLPFSTIAESDLDTLRYIYGRAGASNRLNSLVNSLAPAQSPSSDSALVMPDTLTDTPVSAISTSAGLAIFGGWPVDSAPAVRSGGLDQGGGAVCVPLIRVRIAMQSQYGVLTNVKIRLRGIYDGVHGYDSYYYTFGDNQSHDSGTPITASVGTLKTGIHPRDEWYTGYFNVEPLDMNRVMSFLLHPFDIYEGKTYVQPVIVQAAASFTWTDTNNTAHSEFAPGCGVVLDCPLRPAGCSVVLELISSLHPEYFELKKEMFSKVVFYNT